MEDLKFQVTADTSQAVSAMDRLASSLTKLRTVSNTFNATTLAGQINRINEALNNVNVGKTRSFAQAMNGLKSAMKGDQWGRVEYEIRSIANFLKEVDVTKADALSKSLRALTGANGSDPDSMKQSAENVRLFGEAMKTIGDSGAFVKAVNALTRAANITEFTLADKVRELSAAINEMDADKLMAVAEAAKGLKTVSRQISPNLSEQTVGNDAGGSYNPAPVYTDPSAATAQISTLDQYLANLEARLSGAWGWIKSFGIELGKAASAAVPFVKTIAQLPMLMGSKLAAQVKSVTSALGGLIHQFARIAVIKAIRGLISSITKSFQEGVKALYEYSSAMGTTFAGSMDMLATSANYLSNSLAAMAAPIYNALAPALDFLVDKIVVVMNWINMLFAALGGATTTTIAKKTATAFNNVGGSAGKAGSGAKKAAKELKRFILAFDEINALGSQNSGSGSGGGGGGAGGGGLGGYGYFEEAAINQNIRNIADTIKAYIGAEQWEKLGRFLGDGVNQAIGMVPWEEAGEKLGKALRGVIDTTYYFLDEIKWVELGGHIADFFNNAISNVNWENLGRILVKRWTLLFDMVIGFIYNLDAGELANAMSDFISGLFAEAAKFFASHDWVDIGFTIVKKVEDFILGIDYANLASSVVSYIAEALKAEFGLFGGLLGGIAMSGSDLLDKLFDFAGSNSAETFVMDNIIDPFMETFLGESWDQVKEVGRKIAENIKEGIKEAAPKLYEILSGEYTEVTPLIPTDTPKQTQQEAPKKRSLMGWGASKLGGFAFSTALTTGAWLQKLFNPSGKFTGTGATGGSVIGALRKLKPKIHLEIANDSEDWKSDITDWLGEGELTTFKTGVTNNSATWWENTKRWWDGRVGRVSDFFTSVRNDSTTWWANVISWWGEKCGKVKEFTTNVTNSAGTWWNNVKSWWAGKVGSVANFTTHVSNDAGTWWSNVKTWWNGKVGSVASFSTSVKNDASTWWSNVKSWWKGKAGSLSTTLSIKTPKVTVTWSSVTVFGKTYKYPSGFGLRWNAKGGILDGAQLFGMKGNTLLGGGEAGREAVLPLETHTEWMDTLANRVWEMIPNNSGDEANDAQQIALLREQNDLLRAILDKDNSVEITTTSLTSAFNRKNQRDGKTIIPVGT